jgi:hypothetical protein
MSQSVVDLPDPLEQTAPEPAAGVDDLLARMAGDEIDRLLAESDASREAPAISLDNNAEKPADAEKPATTPPGTEASSTRVAPATNAIDAAEPQRSSAALLESESATTAAERSALNSTPDAAPASEPQTPLANDTEEAMEEAMDAANEKSLPLYLKPLEWLNAPFDALPDTAREAIGKVALLTFFNALAVLIYVLVFRRHR